MERRTLGIAVLVVLAVVLLGLVTVTGGPSDPTGDEPTPDSTGRAAQGHDSRPEVRLTPTLDVAERLSNGSYRVTLTADASSPGYNATASDVHFYGYTLTGEHACTMSYGTVDATKTQTAVCEGFPTIVVSATSTERLANSDVRLVPTATQYRGRWANCSDCGGYTLERERPQEYTAYNGSPPAPTTDTVKRVNCALSYADRRGANFSLLDRVPWRDWERLPPQTSRTFHVTRKNYTAAVRFDRADDMPKPANDTIYDADETPQDLRELQQWRTSTAFRTAVDAETFRSIVSGFAGEEPVVDDHIEALNETGGAVTRHDQTHIACQQDPAGGGDTAGRWTGTRGERVELYVRDEATTWLVIVETQVQHSGPAFRNVSIAGGPASVESSPRSISNFLPTPGKSDS